MSTTPAKQTATAPPGQQKKNLRRRNRKPKPQKQGIKKPQGQRVEKKKKNRSSLNRS